MPGRVERLNSAQSAVSASHRPHVVSSVHFNRRPHPYTLSRSEQADHRNAFLGRAAICTSVREVIRNARSGACGDQVRNLPMCRGRLGVTRRKREFQGGGVVLFSFPRQGADDALLTDVARMPGGGWHRPQPRRQLGSDRSSAPPLHQRGDGGHKLCRIDRFRQMDLESGSQRFHPIV